MKDFNNEFYKFLNFIKNNENFALSRYNDGEIGIIFNDLNINNGDFTYIINNTIYEKSREKLIKSIKYKSNNYYVGIGCRCCIGDDNHNKIKLFSEQDENNLTFGNILVNSNFNKFINEMVPLFEKKEIVLISNKLSITYDLPFKNNIIKHFKIDNDAWLNNIDLIDEIKSYIINENINDSIFLFAAGPFSNILIHECHMTNSNNTYIDVGSTLNKLLYLGLTRSYLRSENTINKYCIW